MWNFAKSWLVCALVWGAVSGAGVTAQAFQEAVVNERANLLRSQADEAYQRGEYARVIELCNQLLQSFPNDNPHVAYHLRASAKIELGRVAKSGRQIREGIADSRSALEKGNGKFPWLNVPYIYGMTALGELEDRPEHLETAIKWVTPLLDKPTGEFFTDEDKGNLYYQRGLAYTAKGETKLAAADFTKATKLAPRLLAPHLRRGASLAALGRNDEAEEAYEQAVERFPNSVIAVNDRGNFRRAKGDLDGAISDFSTALRLDPKFAVGYINRGIAQYDRLQAKEAESDFTQAARLATDLATRNAAIRMRGSSRLAQGNAQGALEDLTVAVRASPSDPSVVEERGIAEFCARQYTAAADDFARTMQVNSKLVRVVPWYWLALQRSGREQEARSLITRTLDQETPPSGWIGALCKLCDGTMTDEELLNAANEGTPAERSQKLCEAYFFLGQAAILTKEPDKAREYFEKALSSNTVTLSAYRASQFELKKFN
ncbi:MAG: tetratricopeptide repeat protein [Planctomycetaceae bacterium]|nr:MAG: tetratricopeptide repeat protein [Planctomycetaceae bacterium]